MHRSLSKDSPNLADYRRRPTTESGLGQEPGHESAIIHRERTPGLELLTVKSGSLLELQVTATPVNHEPAGLTVRRLAEALNQWDATVVRLIAFGSMTAASTIRAALHQSLDDPSLPMTWVEGAACDGRPLAGIQVHAIAGTSVTTLGPTDRPLGRLWKDANATHCVFSGLCAPDISVSRAEQARAGMSLLEAELAEVGMSFEQVARTWLFLDNILDWYGEFNQVRNDFFAHSRLSPDRVPASTGVSGRNPAGSAVALAAWAVKPHDPSAGIVRAVPSPKQCPAPAYGSAFSRAVEIQSPGFRQLLISGTASIEPGGKTAHAGDVDAQIECTMAVVQAILESRGMTLNDATRATAYFRSASDALRFGRWLERNELRVMPAVSACCDICRDDLLFELELDAMV